MLEVLGMGMGVKVVLFLYFGSRLVFFFFLLDMYILGFLGFMFNEIKFFYKMEDVYI